MKIGSLFDGSGGFPLSAAMCGIEPVWASEVEPFPIAVTRSRFPNMKHLGSVTDVKGDEVEPVDVITFGSPCQDLSVAGKRAGLKHTENGDEETTRSGLFMEAIRIIKEMRKATNGLYPRFAVWENVPGAFSSNKGEDFRIVLEEFIKVIEPSASMPTVPKNGWPYADSYCGDGWSLGYRVLDAQFWGVPQRRRRIYLVADFRGERAREVLFEREGLRGYFAQSGAQRKAAARDAEGGSGAADCEGLDQRLMDAYQHHGWRENDVCGTLTAGQNDTVRGDTPLVCVAYSFDSLASNSMKSANPHSGCRQTEVSKCLDTTNPDPSKNQGGVAVVEAVGFDGYNSTDTGDKAATLGVNCGMSTGRNGIIQPIAVATQQGGAEISENGICPTITAAAGMSGNNQPWIVLDDQGGSQINVRHDGKSPTLRAEMHGNVPCVLESAGFKDRAGAQAGSVGYQEEVAPTLLAEMLPSVCYSVENHPADSRVNIDDSGKVQTLTSRMGTGGGNVPMVMEPVPFCKSARARSADDATTWKDGKVANTLNTFDLGEVRANELVVEEQPVYVDTSHADDVVRVDDKASALQARDYKGGKLICCIEGNGSRPSHKGDGYSESDTMYTLNTIERHAVAYWDGGQIAGTLTANNANGAQRMPDKENFNCVIALDRAFYNQGQNAQYEPQFYEDGTVPTLVAKGPGAVCTSDTAGVDCRNATEYPELNGTLQAKDNGGFSYNCNQVVRVRYIVRRLTPTECARLQGFPDKWAHPDIKESLSDEEYRFWMDVRNTHAEINGKTVKEYTREQMLTWYNKLHTDSAEYKLWGNGIALPCALYVMQGIADVLKGDCNV